MSELKESTISSKQVYEGSFLDVRKDIVNLPDGNTSTREWINHPGAACIIPVLSDGRLALIKQYRYPVKSIMIELPAGKLDAGEDPEECAVRELEEEIGYSAGKLTFIICCIRDQDPKGLFATIKRIGASSAALYSMGDIICPFLAK